MLINHIPETTIIGVIWDTFEHDSDSSISQRPINNVGMACDPSDVRRAPVNITWMIIKNIFMGIGRVDKVSATRMQDTLRLTGRSRSIKDKQWIFSIHFFRLTCWFSCRHRFVPPEITFINHFHCFTGTLDHNYMFN